MLTFWYWLSFSLVEHDSVDFLGDVLTCSLHVVPYLRFLHVQHLRLPHLLLHSHHFTLVERLVFAHFPLHEVLHDSAVEVGALFFGNGVQLFRVISQCFGLLLLLSGRHRFSGQQVHTTTRCSSAVSVVIKRQIVRWHAGRPLLEVAIMDNAVVDRFVMSRLPGAFIDDFDTGQGSCVFKSLKLGVY